MELTEKTVICTCKVSEQLLYVLDINGEMHIRYKARTKKQGEKETLLSILHSYNKAKISIREKDIEGNQLKQRDIEEINQAHKRSKKITDTIEISIQEIDKEENEVEVTQKIYIQESIREALEIYSEELRRTIIKQLSDEHDQKQ